jgi:ELWxxDGT repeat protein
MNRPKQGLRLYCFSVFFLTLCVLPAGAQPAYLVKDVNPTTPVLVGFPRTQEFTALGTTLFFIRDDGVHGLEVWKSDGTAAGTTLLRDIWPGIEPSTPGYLTVFDGLLFFIAEDGARGVELWKSDGTAEGTALVKDIRPGLGTSSSPGHVGGLVEAGGALYFAADDGVHGQELWRSDGTADGTVMVEDVNPGSASSNPRLLASGEGTLLFFADDGVHGHEPWISDGTGAGTILVKDVRSGSLSSLGGSSSLGREAIAAPGGGFLFKATDGTTGFELWRTDGTEAGTTLVADINFGSLSSSPYGFTPLGSAVYFAATHHTSGTELWKTDGTPGGTALLRDIQPGGAGSQPFEITASGSRLFFRASDGTHGAELWTSDGTAVGTTLVKDIAPGAASAFPYFTTPPPRQGITPFAGGILFFAEEDPLLNELWKSDGTEAGTVRLTNLYGSPAFAFSSQSWGAAGGQFFFSVIENGKLTLWKSDGTGPGTLQVPMTDPAASSIAPNLNFLFGEGTFASQGGALLFAADSEGTFTHRLWRSDGTSAGTLELATASGVSDITPVPGGLTFLRAGSSLFSTDGTPAGTAAVPNAPAQPYQITALGNAVLYRCGELCRSDGTPGGSGLVKELWAGGSGFPAQLTPVGSTVFFTAEDAAGRELWKSDGTAEGTILVKDIRPDGSAWPDRLIGAGGTLFFSAHTSETGRELWKSDGTAEGTVLVKDIRSGTDSSIQVDLYWRGFTAVVGGTVFFDANDGVSGLELWKSDGTPDGTVLVKDIAPGAPNSGPLWLVAAGGKVYFSADDGIHGREVWVSDGTAAGTRMVADIFPGEDSSVPGSLTAVGHVVVFSATDGVHGLEMWRTNGTAAGTRMIDDIAPGTLSSSPIYFTPAGSLVFFAANDNDTGLEPWAVPRENVVATFGDVPSNHWAWRFVEALAGAGLASGCAPGQYCPGATVSRAETAVFLVRGTHGVDFTPPPATGTVFTDVPADFWAAPWIEQLAADGLTGGCSASPPAFCPDNGVTRAEMAVQLLKAKHGGAYTPPPATGTVFADVPAGFWAAPWIEQLAAEGIATGCGGGAYCPGHPVNRAEMAVFLTRTFDLLLPQN